MDERKQNTRLSNLERILRERNARIEIYPMGRAETNLSKMQVGPMIHFNSSPLKPIASLANISTGPQPKAAASDETHLQAAASEGQMQHGA